MPMGQDCLLQEATEVLVAFLTAVERGDEDSWPEHLAAYERVAGQLREQSEIGWSRTERISALTAEVARCDAALRSALVDRRARLAATLGVERRAEAQGGEGVEDRQSVPGAEAKAERS
jgi:hypothetical protein